MIAFERYRGYSPPSSTSSSGSGSSSSSSTSLSAKPIRGVRFAMPIFAGTAVIAQPLSVPQWNSLLLCTGGPTFVHSIDVFNQYAAGNIFSVAAVGSSGSSVLLPPGSHSSKVSSVIVPSMPPSYPSSAAVPTGHALLHPKPSSGNVPTISASSSSSSSVPSIIAKSSNSNNANILSSPFNAPNSILPTPAIRPNNNNNNNNSNNNNNNQGSSANGNDPGVLHDLNHAMNNPDLNAAAQRVKRKRNSPTPWTEEEHRLFLQGLEKYGKGNWRIISAELLKTRTPIQIASHAQKYFEHLTGASAKRRRTSIFSTPIDSDHGNHAAASNTMPGLISSSSSSSSLNNINSMNNLVLPHTYLPVPSSNFVHHHHIQSQQQTNVPHVITTNIPTVSYSSSSSSNVPDSHK